MLNLKTKSSLKPTRETWTIKRPNSNIRNEGWRRNTNECTKNNFSKIQEVNFSNLKKEMPMNGQEAYQTPNSMDKKINSPEHIIIKH